MSSPEHPSNDYDDATEGFADKWERCLDQARDQAAPAALLIDTLTLHEAEGLVASIADHGILQPVLVDDHDRIVDGVHRTAAAIMLGIDHDAIPTVHTDADIDQELNLHRRHLTTAQRAVMALSRGAADTDATDYGISRSTLRRMRIVHAASQGGDEDEETLLDEVLAGDISLAEAADSVPDPEARQRREAEQARRRFEQRPIVAPLSLPPVPEWADRMLVVRSWDHLPDWMISLSTRRDKTLVGCELRWAPNLSGVAGLEMVGYSPADWQGRFNDNVWRVEDPSTPNLLLHCPNSPTICRGRGGLCSQDLPSPAPSPTTPAGPKATGS